MGAEFGGGLFAGRQIGGRDRPLAEELDGIEHDQHREQHDDADVDRNHRPLPPVVGTMESADRLDVGGDGDQPDREANPGAHTGAQADDREPEWDQQVGEGAADR